MVAVRARRRGRPRRCGRWNVWIHLLFPFSIDVAHWSWRRGRCWRTWVTRWRRGGTGTLLKGRHSMEGCCGRRTRRMRSASFSERGRARDGTPRVRHRWRSLGGVSWRAVGGMESCRGRRTCGMRSGALPERGRARELPPAVCDGRRLLVGGRGGAVLDGGRGGKGCHGRRLRPASALAERGRAQAAFSQGRARLLHIEGRCPAVPSRRRSLRGTRWSCPPDAKRRA